MYENCRQGGARTGETKCLRVQLLNARGHCSILDQPPLAKHGQTGQGDGHSLCSSSLLHMRSTRSLPSKAAKGAPLDVAAPGEDGQQSAPSE